MRGVQSGKILNNRGKTHFTFQGIRFGGCLFLLAILPFCTGKRNSADEKIQSVQYLLRSGDVIVRDGKDDVSQAAKNFNREDKTYSHCGIIQAERDSLFVYHALGGSYNPSQQLLREPLSDFCDPAQVSRFAIYRFPLNSREQWLLGDWVHKNYRSGLAFDLFFNFSTDDRMYCSEFVVKGLNAVTEGRCFPLKIRGGVPFYVTIDDLYLNDQAELVKAITY